MDGVIAPTQDESVRTFRRRHGIAVRDAISQDFKTGQIAETATEPLAFVISTGNALVDRTIIGPGFSQDRDERNTHELKPSNSRTEI